MSLYQYVYHALIKYKKLKSLTFNRDANDLWQWIPLEISFWKSKIRVIYQIKYLVNLFDWGSLNRHSTNLPFLFNYDYEKIVNVTISIICPSQFFFQKTLYFKTHGMYYWNSTPFLPLHFFLENDIICVFQYR